MRLTSPLKINSRRIDNISIVSLLFLLFVLPVTLSSQEADSLRKENQLLKEQLMRMDEMEMRIAELEGDKLKVQEKLAPEWPDDTTASQMVDIPKSELRESHQVLTGSELVEDNFPASWPMFGSEYRIKIGGRVKLDMLYDINGSGDRYQFLMSQIPVEGSPEDANRGYFNMFARESRINFDMRRTTQGKVPLNIFIEGDFWSSAGSSYFRLRHAYIVAGNFIFGQTWTTTSIMESIPNLIDFAAGDGLYGGRAAQIKYQKRINDNWKWALGLEMMDYIGIDNPFDLPGISSLGLPSLAGRLDYSWKTGMIALGVNLAQMRWDGGDSLYTTATQFAAVIGGRQYIGKDYFTFNVALGMGSGDNIMALTGSNSNAILTPDGELETMPAAAIVLGYVHKWNDKFTTNASLAYTALDPSVFRAPESMKAAAIGHVNLIYQASERLSTGMEYMWGERRNKNSDYGRANRLQAMVKFDF
ncbi:DcaP family trimeric outer membrane transporter [Maribellus sediminis]|uniref:DcaP family trimeric outer membrane transporter n=1 Tax=Maribellus sediminis TaxID=2696285 RepID=UPI001431E710|nr:DcaP family trimeric outer membrane transporter [Maribellus sediminis]